MPSEINRRRTLLTAAVCAGVLACGAAYLSARLQALDREHTEFLELGSSINGFLLDVCEAHEAAASGRPERLVELGVKHFGLPPSSDLKNELVGPVRVARSNSPSWDQVPRATGGSSRVEDIFGRWEVIDRSSCKIVRILSPAATRTTVEVKIELQGRQADAGRVVERAFRRWQLERHEGSWRIVDDELKRLERTSANVASFEEVLPDSTGVDFVHHRDPKLDKRGPAPPRFGVAEHASGGMSVADFDDDGWSDLLLLDGVRSRLFRNVSSSTRIAEGPVGSIGHLDRSETAQTAEALPAVTPSQSVVPRFADVTAAVLGDTELSAAHSAVFFDADGDGDRDLFVARYLEPSRYLEQIPENRPEAASAVHGGVRFVERSAHVGLDFVVPATSTVAFDYDLDGDLDLYVAAFGNAFEATPRLPFLARNGGANLLLRNDGGRFVEVAARARVADTGWTLAATSADVNLDGWPDLMLANDFGRKVLYLNRGDGTFEERAKEAGVLDFSGGMGVVAGDLDGDGAPDLYTSNIQSNQRWFGEDVTVRRYVANVLGTRWAVVDFGEFWELWRLLGADWRGLARQVGEGNSLFRNRSDGTFEELDVGVERAGWGWGVAMFDFDNDADLDLYAANGFISGPGPDL